jgi:hypothetical protein
MLPAAFSDRRLKENIDPIGKTYDGQTIYRYNFKGDNRTQVGLIAQEVEKHHKDAVGSSRGMKTVDYKRATEDAADRGHFYNGGVIPFRRGYADGMTVDEADLPAIGAQDVRAPDVERQENPLAPLINRTAEKIGVRPVDLGTAISYETAGTFDPWKRGPTTKWGEHRGLLQWGEPQRKQYGVTQDSTLEQQMDAAGRYLVDRGVKPGMGLKDIYSAINAGYVGRYNASDERAGGAPGTVEDKVAGMGDHRAKAARLLGIDPGNTSDQATPRPPANIPDRTDAGRAVALAKQPSTLANKDGEGSFPIRPPATARGKEQDWSDFFTSKQFILPALTAIGTMGTTPTRDFGTALSAGLLGGVKSYQDLDKSLADLEQKREEIPKVTAETGEVKMRTRALEAGLYERQYIKGIGMFLIDKSNPRNYVQITDKDLKPIPGTGVESRIGEIPYSKDSARPDVDTTAPVVSGQPKTSELITPKKPGESIVQKPTSATSWTPMTSVPENYIPPEQIGIVMGDKGKALGALGAKTVEEQNRKAEAAYDQLYALEEMDKQFKNLPSEGFLVPGSYASERLEFAKKMNTFVQGIGGKPAFDVDDVAAMESISKNSFRLGSALARSIGSREPGFIVQQSVQANPGIENSPIGYERISAGLREAAKYEQDKNQFYTEYYSKFGHLEGAEKMFRDANPAKMYADRAILSTVRPVDNEAFTAYAARETDQSKLNKAKEILDKKYGKGVADKILGK